MKEKIQALSRVVPIPYVIFGTLIAIMVVTLTLNPAIDVIITVAVICAFGALFTTIVAICGEMRHHRVDDES